MKNKKIKLNIIVITFMLLMSACSSSQRQIEFSKQIAFPVETKTRATDSLACFGDMLSTYRKRSDKTRLLRLAVVSVKDATDVSTVSYANSEIPSDFKDMTLSLISRIGGPVRVIHIPTSKEIIDAVRYGSIAGKKVPFLDDFKATHYRGDTSQIYGALTEYDRITSNKERKLDGSIEFGKGRGETNLELSSSGIVNVARMTMDFRVVHAAVGDVVNNTSSSNTVTVYQRGNDKSFGLSIDGNTVGYSISKSIVDARHKAIRLLIEWGLIESIGRYALVPYWKCLPNSGNRKYIGFKDLVSNNNFYNFQKFNKQNNKRKTYRRSSGLVDMRDKLLMNSVLSYYQNAEYIGEKARRLLRRSEKDTSLIQRSIVSVSAPTKKDKNRIIEKAVDTKSRIKGKSTLRRNVLNLYKRDARYAKLSDAKLLKRLHGEFVRANIIHPKDGMKRAHTYLALWLNVPVQKNARWMK